MTFPVYAIRTYTGENLDHTITKDALNLYSKEIVTDGIGYFMFTVPTVKGLPDPYYYDDIALNDTVKIWFGYDSIDPDSDAPTFVGKVGKISAPLTIQSGHLRVISGLSQGEILLKRFKKNKYYDGVGASTIVTEWAEDLDLGTGEIEADSTEVTLEVRTKTYFDLLREISDYWYDADTQIRKDFYVDINNNLVWKSRPFRTSGVETLTVGDNIISYQVTRDMDSIKNDIMVYGAAEQPIPTSKDWCESLTDWSASDGSISLYGPNGQKVGNYTIRGWTGGGGSVSTFKRVIPRITIRNVNTVYFWHYTAVDIDNAEVRLHAPNPSNYFKAILAKPTNNWTFNEIALGPNNEYYADSNPNGVWTKTGSPNWWNIQEIQFGFDYGQNDRYCHVDGLYFYPERWLGGVDDNPSVMAYGLRELEITDDKLHSVSDCTKRACSLIYQLANPSVQIEVSTPGNTNILVGDRLSMTIPAENISAQNYDDISVEHNFSRNGFKTKATMVNTANIRQPVTGDDRKLLSNLRRYIRELSMDEKLVR